MKTFFFSVVFFCLGCSIGCSIGSAMQHRFQQNCADNHIEAEFSGPCIGHHAPKEISSDTVTDNMPEISASFQELDRRDHVIADALKQQQEEILELHSENEQLKSFIENLINSFFTTDESSPTIHGGGGGSGNQL